MNLWIRNVGDLAQATKYVLLRLVGCLKLTVVVLINEFRQLCTYAIML